MTTVTGHGIFGHSKDQTSKSLIRCSLIKKCIITLDVILPEPETEVWLNWLVMVLKYVIKRWT